ncbi:MAG: hypothetical protein AAFZ89_13880 [Bacteroidota bacterium]
MRYFILGILFLCIACNGDGETPVTEIPSRTSLLIGNWQLEATKISPGGIVDWTTVSNGSLYTFKPDGTFSLSSTDNALSGSYSEEGNELSLRFVREGQSIRRTYFMNFVEGNLVLQYVGCIESCAERYRRVN